MHIGIDLGTTNTVVSYIDENGMWKLLEFRNSGRTGEPHFLPSCVAVRNGVVIVGQPAIDHGLTHPDEFISNTKYDMGNPEVSYHVGQLKLTPVKAAEYVLYEVYNELRRQFPQESTFNAFVTVPARFGNEARQATKEALRNAGFEMQPDCLTDEPISAAIAYSSVLDGDKLVLVVDIGGGTFDLSLLKASIIGGAVHPGRLEPVGWDGDLHLGGNNVDELLVRLMTRQFLQDGGKDLYAASGAVFPRQEETRAAALIRAQASHLKSQLYSEGADHASVCLPDLLDGKTLDFTITKEEYAREMSEIAAQFSRCLQNLYVGSGYTPGDTDHVLVVGGMAHELCLLNTLYSMFGKQNIIVPEDSMLLVAKGAAICNSNQRLHIENKAYSSIGLLKHGRTAAEPIIRQGASIHTGDVFKAEISPESPDATALCIELVEYQGAFDPHTCTTILRETIQLVSGASQGSFINRIFRRPVMPKLELQAVFTEDKILQITVVQADGTDRTIDVRL